MTRADIEGKVRTDYANFAGKLAKVKYLTYYKDCHSSDLYCPDFALVRVVPNQRDNEIIVWNDDYCDPVWVVEPVDVPGLPEGTTSCWVHGISYQTGEGKTNEGHPELVDWRELMKK